MPVNKEKKRAIDAAYRKSGKPYEKWNAEMDIVTQRTIKNVSVAVVGGAGFLGSHLVNHLIEDRNCNVLVIDNLVSGRREFIHPEADFEHADITQSESHLCRVFDDYGVKYVFNFAAWPYVPDSFARHSHVFTTNANGALNVINAANEAGAVGILQVSSAEIYGGQGRIIKDCAKPEEWSKISEDEAVEPHSSYGAAKAAIDAMVQVRWKEDKTPCIALRQFNCVGERETHPYIVPEIIGQLSAARREPSLSRLASTAISLGNNSFRDFLYAGDAVRAAVELLEKGEFGEVYNLGSETGIKMYDLAQLIGREMGWHKVIVEKDAARVRPWEIWSLLSCNDKINSVIDYRPQVTLKEALRLTIDYYTKSGSKWCWEK